MNYRDGFYEYYLITFFYIIPAIFLGIICQKIMKHLQTKFNLDPLTSIIIHLLLLTFVLYIVEIHISLQYGTNWQSITPGLFFVSIFFGLQLSLYDNLDKIYNLKL